MAMTPASDVTELLGCFEQMDSEEESKMLIKGVEALVEGLCYKYVCTSKTKKLKAINGQWWAICKKMEMSGAGVDEDVIEMVQNVLTKAKELVRAGDEKETIATLSASAKKVKGLFKGPKAGSAFRWVDGVLVKAMLEGKWLSLNNVNFCPSSVLDRLNPLMEMGGELVLTEGGGDGEGGDVRVIKPHENFRLFLSMNSDKGEVSRAMRNRCIEVALIGGFGDGDEDEIKIDVLECLRRAGVEDAGVAAKMKQLHEAEITNEAEGINVRKLKRMAELWRDLAKAGMSFDQALEESWRSCYGVVDDEEHVDVKDVENGQGMFPLVCLDEWFSDWRRARAKSDARLLEFLSKEWMSGATELPSALVQLMGEKGVTKWLQITEENAEEVRQMCLDVAVVEYVLKSGLGKDDFEARRAAIGDGKLSGEVEELLKEVDALSLAKICPFVGKGGPVDLRTNRQRYSVFSNGLDATEFNEMVDKSKMKCLDRLEALLKMTRVQSIVKDKKRLRGSEAKKRLSPVALSYAIASGSGSKMDEASGNKLIPLLARLFDSVDSYLVNLEIGGEASRRMWKARDEIFSYLTSFPSSAWLENKTRASADKRFLVFWRWLLKAYRELPGNDEIDRVVAMVDKALGRNGVFSRDLMWKKGGRPAGCVTPEGLGAKFTLLQVGSRFAAKDKGALTLAKMVDGGSGALFLGEEFKREVLMAMCTLQWELTDEKGSRGVADAKGATVKITDGILSKADAAAETFRMDLKRNTVDVDIKTVENDAEAYEIVRGGSGGVEGAAEFVENLMTRFSEVQASVVVDRWSVWEEDALLDALCGCRGKGELKAMLPRIKTWIGATLKGERGVERCRGWQTLVWAGEGGMDWEGLQRLRKVLLPTLVTFNSHDVWNGGFNDLDGVEAELKSPVLWGGDEKRGKEDYEEEEEEEDNVAWSMRGYGKWQSPLNSTCVGRIFSDAGDAIELAGGRVRKRITLENAKIRSVQATKMMKGMKTVGDAGGWGVVRFGVLNILRVLAEAEGGRLWPDSGKLVAAVEESQPRLSEVDVKAILDSCNDEIFKSLSERVLIPLVEALLGEARGEEELARALVLLGLATVKLYTPSEPLDPGLKPAAKASNIEMRISSLAAKGEVKRWARYLESGGGEEQIEGWELEKARAEKQRKKVVARPEEGGWDRLYSEMVQFGETMGSESTVLRVLEEGDDQGWVASCNEFVTRMLELYGGGYEDVVHGVTSGIALMMKGVGLKTTAAKRGLGGEVSGVVKFLMMYPWGADVTKWDVESAMRAVKGVGKGNVGAAAVLGCQVGVLFAMMQRAEVLVRTKGGMQGGTDDEVKVLRSCFSEVVKAWGKAEELREAEEEGISNKVETEEDREERKLREQFPDFSREFFNIVKRIERRDEMLDDEEEEEEEEEEGDDVKVDSTFKLSEEMLEALCEVHGGVFGAGGNRAVGDGHRMRVFGACYDAAAALLPVVKDEVVDLDGNGFCGNLMALGAVKRRCGGMGKGGSFSGENVGEVLKAEKALGKVVMRITALLKAFPGHAVLLCIGQVAERVRGLDVREPLAKVLSGIEVLLKKAQEWEQHASPRVKIGQPLEDIAKLVADWRKLELESWGGLLGDREEKCERSARKLWARMWKVLEEAGGESGEEGVPAWVWKNLKALRGLGFRSDGEDRERHELIKTLDSFLLTAGLGEFKQRLKLMESFAGEVRWCGGIELSRIMSSLVEYYSRFLPVVERHWQAQKEAIEKRLKNEVKLAKWDDQNYYALAETTEKNHRKLNGFLKEYDEVLGQGVGTVIEMAMNKGVREKEGGVGGEERGATEMPSDTEMWAGVAVSGELGAGSGWSRAPVEGGDIARICNVAQKHLEKLPLSPAKEASEGCSDLTASIFDRISVLRGEGVTKAMKHRGLVDLFKALKTNAGVGGGVWRTPHQVRTALRRGCCQLASLRFTNAVDACFSTQIRSWFELLKIGRVDVDLPGWDKCSSYYNRCLAEVSRLRGEVKQFGSRFIGSRETGLMVGVSEQLLLMLLQQRCLFVEGVSEILKVGVGGGLRAEDVVDGQREKKRAAARLVDKLRVVAGMLRDVKILASSMGDGTKVGKLEKCVDMAERTLESLKETSSAAVLTKELCKPVEDWQERQNEEMTSILKEAGDEWWNRGVRVILDELQRKAKAEPEGEASSRADVVDEAVKTMQIIVQNVVKASERGKEEEDLTVAQLHALATSAWTACDIAAIRRCHDELVAHVEVVDREGLPRALEALNLVGSVSRWVSEVVFRDMVTLNYSAGKMLYVIVRVFRQIVAKGFCSEEEGEGDGEGGEGSGATKFEDDVEGTGMGEGDGKEDVTDQIEVSLVRPSEASAPTARVKTRYCPSLSLLPF